MKAASSQNQSVIVQLWVRALRGETSARLLLLQRIMPAEPRAIDEDETFVTLRYPMPRRVAA